MRPLALPRNSLKTEIPKHSTEGDQSDDWISYDPGTTGMIPCRVLGVQRMSLKQGRLVSTKCLLLSVYRKVTRGRLTFTQRVIGIGSWMVGCRV